MLKYLLIFLLYTTPLMGDEDISWFSLQSTIMSYNNTTLVHRIQIGYKNGSTEGYFSSSDIIGEIKNGKMIAVFDTTEYEVHGEKKRRSDFVIYIDTKESIRVPNCIKVYSTKLEKKK